MIIYLEHIAGSKKGQVESFESERIRIGRQADNDLRVDPEKERGVSGHHAEIYRQGEAFWVKDLQSKNGTYVNGRLISQPTPVAPGDIIQFSPHGPKVALLTKTPSQEPSVAATSFGEAAPLAARIGPVAIGIWPLIGLAVAGLLVLAGLAYSVWSSRWVLFTILFLGTIVAGALLAWWRSGWRSPFRVWRRAPREEGRGAPQPPIEGEDLKELHRKWAEALATLRKANQGRRSEDPIYAAPWVLVLGETGSGKTETIRTANPLSWLSSIGRRQETSVTQNCDWWFFDKAVLLDTAGRYSARTAEKAEGAEWREILSLLKRTRPEEPIDGVVMTVAADALVSRSAEQLQEGANQVRRRLDEISHHLGTSFPVYLLVTKMDCISGFTEFIGGLPEAVRGQAMGAANDDLNNPAGAAAFLDRAFRSVAEKLDRLRLARMDEEDSPGALHRVYLFPEEFRCLRGPLRAFAGALFRHSPYQETPILRGLFFVSAKQGGACLSQLAKAMGFPGSTGERMAMAGGVFVRDIFSTILPQDRPLVRKTPLRLQKARRARFAGLIAAAAISLVVAGLFTLSFWRNSQALSHLALEACLELPAPSSEGSFTARLKGLDGCREVVESLAPRSFWGGLASNFGLGQTGRIEEPLRQRYLQAFRMRILDPLEARIEQKLVAGPEAPLYVGALIQRINLLARCRSKDGCSVVDDSMRPSYRVMLAAESPNLKDDDPRVVQLAMADEAYLRWQPDQRSFEEMQNRQVQRVMRWLQSGGLRADWILASASSQFPAIRSRDFWGLDAAGQVDPPYTQRALTEGIRPLLLGLKLEAPEAKEVREPLARFEGDYRSEFFRQWDRFLTSFPQGERMAGGRAGGRELATKILGPDSPYRRVIDAASSNLTSLIGAAPQERDVPSWAVTLQRYTALKAKTSESQKGAKQKPEDPKAKASDEDRELLGYLTGYLDALDQLRGELSTPEKAFKAAQKALEEGEPSDKPSYFVQKAIWNRDQLRRAIGSRQGEDRAFWVLVSRPLELAWRTILDQAGLYLQGQWEALRLEIADLPAGPKAGKVLAFVNGQVAPFLERRRDAYSVKTLLNDNVIFTRPFLDYLSRTQSVSSEDLGRLELPRQIVVPL
jgi:type VI secretion system protein ImpL